MASTFHLQSLFNLSSFATILCLVKVISSLEIVDFPVIDSRNILLVPDIHDTSHIGLFTAVGRRLSERGHNVSLLSRESQNAHLLKENQNFKVILYRTNNSSCNSDRISLIDVSSDDVLFNQGFYRARYDDCHLKECNSVLGNQILIKTIYKANFDKIICDLSSPCCAILARYVNVTFVNFATKGPLGTRHFRSYYVPNTLADVPEFMSGFTNKMDRMQRVQNVLLYLHSVFVYDYWMLGAYDRLKQNHGILKRERTYDVVGMADLLLVNMDFTVEFPRPYMPNVIFVGGISARNSSELDKDLESFLETSGKDGVVVVSLHSILSSSRPDVFDMIWLTLDSIPQKVVWTDNGNKPQTNNTNVIVIQSDKLNDVLGHKNVKAFVHHGDVDLAYMSIYHAVPSVVIPVFADEAEVSVRLQAKGMSLMLDIHKLTVRKMSNAVYQAVDNKTLQNTVIWWSDVHHDFHNILLPPIDRAVFWIEHVMKFGGGHLRSSAFNLNTIQYFLLDVMLFLITCLCISVYAIRKCCFMLCNKKSISNEGIKLKQQ